MLQNGVENPDDPETSTPFLASNYTTLDSYWAAVDARRDSDKGAHISNKLADLCFKVPRLQFLVEDKWVLILDLFRLDGARTRTTRAAAARPQRLSALRRRPLLPTPLCIAPPPPQPPCPTVRT